MQSEPDFDWSCTVSETDYWSKGFKNKTGRMSIARIFERKVTGVLPLKTEVCRHFAECNQYLEFFTWVIEPRSWEVFRIEVDNISKHWEIEGYRELVQKRSCVLCKSVMNILNNRAGLRGPSGLLLLLFSSKEGRAALQKREVLTISTNIRAREWRCMIGR